MNFAAADNNGGGGGNRNNNGRRRGRGGSRGGRGNRGSNNPPIQGNADEKPPKKRRRRRRKKGNGNNNNNNNNKNSNSNRGESKSSQQSSQPPAAVNNPSSRTTSTTRAALTASGFDDLASCGVGPEILRSFREVFGYDRMTKCQEQSIPPAMTGADLLVKAKTGTGKTIGFLVPALQRLVTHTTAQSRRGAVGVLIISPTRELASQIAEEARQILRFVSNVSLQVVFGGTNVKRDVSRFQQLGFPDVLVATPGRLNDHLENSGLARACEAGLQCLIFDEADQLLEMGFRPAIRRALGMLPPKASRQTLLFSATMPKDVMGIARFALRDSFKHIDTVGDNDAGTHARIPQAVTVYPSVGSQFAELLAVVREGQREHPHDHRIMVFFTTARLTQLHAELFNKAGVRTLEIHSRKSQSYRTRVSKEFRENAGRVMFSSDVSARGMDYPDVTLVIQVGIPSDKAQYIHRIGRTGRAGKQGRAVLLLAEFERVFLDKELRDQPVQLREPAAVPADMDLLLATARTLPQKTLTTGYQAWLGYYNSNQRRLRLNPELLVSMANEFAMEACGCSEPPALLARTVGKMGLRGTRGLRVEGKNGVPRSDFGQQNRNNGRGGGGRRGGRGGSRGGRGSGGGAAGFGNTGGQWGGRY